jgi:hypothetical protein
VSELKGEAHTITSGLKRHARATRHLRVQLPDNLGAMAPAGSRSYGFGWRPLLIVLFFFAVVFAAAVVAVVVVAVVTVSFSS